MSTAENLVTNGDFEVPRVTDSAGWDIFASGTTGLGWTVEWYGGSPTYNGETRPTTALLELQRTANDWSHYIGDQHTELDTDWDGPIGSISGEPASVKIYQDLTTSVGVSYILKYAWSPRPDQADNVLEVWWDGAKIADHSGSGVGNSDTVWTLEVELVTGGAGATTRLEFIEAGTADGRGMLLDAVSVVADPVGKLEVVKNRLNDLVYEAVGGTVSNNWAVGVQQIGTFPLSTLRFGSLILTDENYGGKVPQDGCWATYEFSIFVHEKQDPTYLDTTSKFYLAMDAADDILDTLISRSEVEAEKNTTGIYKIFNLALDGVQPDKRARNVGRIIVTGRILTKWLDP